MDARLEPVDQLIRAVDPDDYDDAMKRELAWAVIDVDKDDAESLYWLAAIAAARADEISR